MRFQPCKPGVSSTLLACSKHSDILISTNQSPQKQRSIYSIVITSVPECRESGILCDEQSVTRESGAMRLVKKDGGVQRATRERKTAIISGLRVKGSQG